MPSSVKLGVAADQLEDARIFVRLEAVLGDQLGRDGGFVGAPRWLAASVTPPAEIPPARRTAAPVGPAQRAASTRFSGCGIMPSTLPRSLMMPAMACMAPLGFQSGRPAVGRRIAEGDPALAFQPRDGLAVGDVVAFAVRDRHADHLAGIVAAREGVSVRSTRRWTSRQMKRSCALRISTPGSRPASQRSESRCRSPSTRPPWRRTRAPRP